MDMNNTNKAKREVESAKSYGRGWWVKLTNGTRKYCYDGKSLSAYLLSLGALDHLLCVYVKGIVFSETGKRGSRISDGVAGKEFENRQGARVWAYADGTIKVD